MIHYYGMPIGSQTVAHEALCAGHAFPSFAACEQLPIVLEVCQSFAVDNGAFSHWRKGTPVRDWSPFYEWVDTLRNHPGFDFACIPDVIDGDEDANDRLVSEWPFARWQGAPVWHMHESIERLVRLVAGWPRVCIGSSGEYAVVGNFSWWCRMHEAMAAICDERGHPRAKIHGLRMLNPAVFAKLPFASADSTNIARNVGIDSRWKGTYAPPTKEARARVMRSRIEAYNGAQSWPTIDGIVNTLQGI